MNADTPYRDMSMRRLKNGDWAGTGHGPRPSTQAAVMRDNQYDPADGITRPRGELDLGIVMVGTINTNIDPNGLGRERDFVLITTQDGDFEQEILITAAGARKIAQRLIDMANSLADPATIADYFDLGTLPGDQAMARREMERSEELEGIEEAA